MKRLVIGILAHVDSGKTTLSEALLYLSGGIKKLGRVDHGDAFLDSFALERERGITIFSKQAILRLDDSELTLLDTPGHVDFSTETERTLQALDYAIILISGTDGVQSHTETLWRLLEKHNIPTFLFINKMDLAGVDRGGLMSELKLRFGDACVDFSGGLEASDNAEALAMSDPALLDEFLASGVLQDSGIVSAIAKRLVFPCYFGSALKLEGVDAMLKGLNRYTRAPCFGVPFGAKVFKIAYDEQGERLTYLKITGGTLKVKAVLKGMSTARHEPWQEKANQLRIYSGAKYQAVDEAFPGMICAVTGLTQTFAGEGLGAEPCSELPVLEPVLNYRVELPAEIDAQTAISKLRLLEEEDPQLHVVWNEALQEIHLQLMGEVQLEVLKSLILERFQMHVSFGPGKILYKETISAPVEGVGHFEPLRHYAEVHLLLEPNARGSGLSFSSSCGEDSLDRNWQRLILTHLEEKIHPGVLTGSPITDIKITLAAGRAHQKHTEGGDFRQATYRAVRQGLKMAESILLEPWFDFYMEVPSETVGRAMADLQRMNASFSPPENRGGASVLMGSVPVAAIRDYQLELIGYTHGRGRLSCTPGGYRPCANAETVIDAIGYDSDGDLENPADSVFCAHGAGFIVKWNEVPAHMHLPSTLARKISTPEPPSKPSAKPSISARAAAYCASLEEDKELMKIFERAYGPIKRDPRAAFQSVHHEPPKEILPPPRIYSGPEYLLVDGYNIIFAWDELSALARENLDAARNRLINILCNYQGFCECELILVFDAYMVKGNPGEVEKFHNISVVYTKEAETADMYIEKVTHELGKKRRIRVATSDGLEQLIILNHGALRVSARAFYDEVKQAEDAIREFLER